MKKLITFLGIVVFVAAQVIFYWLLQPGITFVLAPIRNIQQTKGNLAVLDVPLNIDLDQAILQNRIIDMEGKTVLESKFELWYPGDQYKILTDSRLEEGDYNVVMSLSYKLNPIQWRHHEFIIAVLNVRR